MADETTAPQQTYVHANGAVIPAIGLGTWMSTDDAGMRAVETALKLGYRHIDTASAYKNEGQVGEGIRASGVARADIFLTTKVWYETVREDEIEPAAEASLKRLGTDYVDLLLIHWPNSAVPLADTMAGLSAVKRKGLARHIGISNFPAKLVREAAHLASEPLVTNQCEYHPDLDQSPVLDACRAEGMSFTAYSPLGRGALLKSPVMTEVANEIGRTPAQVVLRWLVQQPGVIAVPKSVTPERIAENIAVFDFALSPQQMARISGLAHPDGRLIKPSWSPAWDD